MDSIEPARTESRLKATRAIIESNQFILLTMQNIPNGFKANAVGYLPDMDTAREITMCKNLVLIINKILGQLEARSVRVESKSDKTTIKRGNLKQQNKEDRK